MNLARPQVVLDIDLKTQCRHVVENVDGLDEKPCDQRDEGQAENHQSEVPDPIGQIEWIERQPERHSRHDPASRTAKMPEQNVIYLRGTSSGEMRQNLNDDEMATQSHHDRERQHRHRPKPALPAQQGIPHVDVLHDKTSHADVAHSLFACIPDRRCPALLHATTAPRTCKGKLPRNRRARIVVDSGSCPK